PARTRRRAQLGVELGLDDTARRSPPQRLRRPGGVVARDRCDLGRAVTPYGDRDPRNRGRPVRPAPLASHVVSDRLSSAEVAKVARLAMLDLAPDEIEAATAELGKMLDHFAEIDGLDLSDLEPM